MDRNMDSAAERERAWYPTENLPKRSLAFEIIGFVIVFAIFMVGMAVSH